MKKLNQPPFARLKSAERALNIYHQIDLELEVGDRIKLYHFNISRWIGDTLKMKNFRDVL